VEDIVERIMAFDKNKDGKVTKDELPERMHHLIELGDLNKDGGLDKDEIKKLATKLAATPTGFSGGPFTAGGGPGGLGGGPVKIGFGAGPPGGFGIAGDAYFGPGGMEGVVEDLKLSGQKKEKALAAVKAHQEHVSKLLAQARVELLDTMKQILSDEEFEDFHAALDRPPGASVFVGPVAGPKGGGQKKLTQPPK
jgi:hypothetical protein